MNKNSKKIMQGALTFAFSKILSTSLSDKKLEKYIRDYILAKGTSLGFSKTELFSIAKSVVRVARLSNHRFKNCLRDGCSLEAAKDSAYRVLMNTKNYDVVVHSVNKAERHRSYVNKKDNMKKTMSGNRQSGNVFYLCSEHSNPGKDHAPYQGKLYVDKMWKSTLKLHGEDYDDVEKFLDKNKIMTVQKVCSAPVYMIFRPYCRHYFIPVSTESVLTRTLSEIKSTVPMVEKKRRSRAKNYYREKMKTKSNIGKALKRC